MQPLETPPAALLQLPRDGTGGGGGAPGFMKALYLWFLPHSSGSHVARRQHSPGAVAVALLVMTVQKQLGVASQCASHWGMV
jgi:hypothetical protein